MKTAFLFLKKCIWLLDPLVCYRPLPWGWLDHRHGTEKIGFYVKVPEDKNLEHEQNVEACCTLSRNHSKQKCFQAMRRQQVYYQNQNWQCCRQSVWATAQADRKFWFTSRHFRNCVGTHVAMLGEFSGVNVSAGHTSDLPFAVPRGLTTFHGVFPSCWGFG